MNPERRYEPVDMTIEGGLSFGLFYSLREARKYLQGIEKWQLWECERQNGAMIFSRKKLVAEKNNA